MPNLSNPTVSVVLSVFNGERFLREAVESILSQTFRDFEFIIIDDGSTDGSPAILDSFQQADPRVRVYHQENKGLIESLNRGCNLARGKYIARMDADDIAVPERFSRQVEFLDKHPETGIVGGAIECINSSGKTLKKCIHPLSDREIRSALFQGSNGFCHPAVLMRTEAVMSVGAYRRVVVHAEDYDLWLRIADRFKMANLPEIVLKYRLHADQTGSRLFREMALTSLAAWAAGNSRRAGGADNLDSAPGVTSELLTEMGVDESTQQTWLARRYLTYYQNMSEAGEHSVEPAVALALLRSEGLQRTERRVVADFQLWAARRYWSQGRFVRSLLAATRGLLTWPIILGRPLKHLVRSLAPRIRPGVS